MFSTPAMRDLFSARSWVQAMLDVEVALATAEERVGVIPRGTAEAIRAHSDAAGYSVEALGLGTAAAANPGGPLAAALMAAVGPPAADYVHFGATSQDVVDTAAMLLARRGMDLVQASLAAAAGAAATLAEGHRGTVMASRTLLQQGVPITFGLKAAGWLLALDDAAAALARVQANAVRLQFGGASGCLATLGEDGPRISAAFAEALGMAEAPLPWHAWRGPFVEIAAAVGLAAGAAAKVARDVILLVQTEVGEVTVATAAGEGRSSAMPQKRNPVAAVRIDACARRAQALVAAFFSGMAHEHERAAGAWQAEWTALRDLFELAGAATDGCAELLAGLQVDGERMRANIDPRTMAEAVTMRLARSGMRPGAARELVERALATAGDFREALVAAGAWEHLEQAALEEALDPAAVIPAASAYLDRALAAHRRLAADGPPR